MNTLHFLLRDIRKSKGLSLREVSKGCGISFTYLGEIERGVKSGNLRVIEKILNYYDYIVDFRPRVSEPPIGSCK